jgi:hypothetical protein
MAEVMTVEAIIDAYWQLRGFWTKPRFAFQTPKGGWSDVDLLAYCPEGRHLVIAESKVQGRKKAILTCPQPSFFAYERGDYLKFVDNVPLICKTVFKDFPGMVETLTIQLVSNYYLTQKMKEDAKKEVRDHVSNSVKDKNVDVLLHTTLEIFSEVIRLEDERDQGKRSGNPVIDIARELNRYMDPTIHGAGKNTDAIKIGLIEPLRALLAKVIG